MFGTRARTLLPSAALALALAAPLCADAAEVGPPRPVRIMPLGDSITEGTSGDATWRYWLQKSVEAEGCVVDYVGSRRGVLHGKPRFSDFDPDHEGHWGWTTAQVKAQIDRWARDAQAMKQEVKQKTEQVAEWASDIAGKAALASFFMLLLGAAAAGAGGAMGAPHWSEEKIV